MFDFTRPSYVVHTVKKTDKDYPKNLLCLGDEAPACIYCIGDKSLLSHPIATVVGNQMTSTLVSKTDKVLSLMNPKYSIINMANEGVEYYTLETSTRTGSHKPILMLSATFNVDEPEYDDIKPLIDDIVRVGGLVISLYDDTADFIENYYSFNKIMVILSDSVYCPIRDVKSLPIKDYAMKIGKKVVEF